MARERREMSDQEKFKLIEERVEKRYAEMREVPLRRIEERPEMRVDPKAERLAERLADALDKGVKALDRW